MKDTSPCRKAKQASAKRGHLKHRSKCPCKKARKQAPKRQAKTAVQRAIEQQKLNAMIAKARLIASIQRDPGRFAAALHLHV